MLARRHRNGAGEVDLIVRRGDTLAFVEVKARATVEAALEGIGYAAQRRVQAAGEAWLSRNPAHGDCGWRCDVVVVRPWRWPIHLADVW